MKKKRAAMPEDHPDLFGAGTHTPEHASAAAKEPAAAKTASAAPAAQAGAPLPIRLEKPLVFVDLEATGLDVREDRIVELAALKVHPDGRRETYTMRVNPGVPIPMEASAVHGIFDADVKDAPAFKDVAKEFYTFLMDCDLGGFGVARYDTHLLAQEFKRAGFDFTDTGRRVIDAQIIFHKSEPRDLTAALKFYRGKELVDAHGAKADCEAALEVFLGELERYADLPRDVAGLHAFCNQSDDRFVDPHGRLFWKHGQACFNFGKYRSRTLEEISREDPRYLQWLIGEGKSSPELLEIYRRALRGHFPQKKA